ALRWTCTRAPTDRTLYCGPIAPGGSDTLRIAQVSPLFESVPPVGYGGTERVVAYLTDELVRMGHQVTLFASGDSHSSARLVAGSRHALRLDPDVRDPLPHQAVQLEQVWRRLHDFDVIHFHLGGGLHFPLLRRASVRAITTAHGRQDTQDVSDLYRAF